jgi:hypothetical protein
VSESSPRRLRRAASIVVAVALLALFPGVSAGQLAPAREYEIKAAFLFNFATFVNWPDDAFKSQTEDLRLAVIGHDPFDRALDRLVAGRVINQHRVVIVYSSDAPVRPHMVFVGASERKQLPTILAALSHTPTLTVSDMDQFAEHGGVIGMVAAGQSVKFVINRAAATRARLRVSSRLLSLATLLDRDSIGSSAMMSGSLADATSATPLGEAGLHSALNDSLKLRRGRETP